MSLIQGDECGSLADFGTSSALSVKYSFSNFSFKVRRARPRIFFLFPSKIFAWYISLKEVKRIIVVSKESNILTNVGNGLL